MLAVPSSNNSFNRVFVFDRRRGLQNNDRLGEVSKFFVGCSMIFLVRELCVQVYFH